MTVGTEIGIGVAPGVGVSVGGGVAVSVGRGVGNPVGIGVGVTVGVGVIDGGGGAMYLRAYLSGKTDAQIKDDLIRRYGDYVLFQPPVRLGTWLLWFGPFALAAGAGVVLVLRARRRGT